MKLDLTGKWLFKTGYDKEFAECVVPGTTICDMIAQNRIKNPLFNPFKGVSDDKDATFANLGLTDFIYKKSFSVSEDFLKAKKIYLVSKCIDTLVLIYLNGREVTHHENAFTEFRDEVKEFLVPGENVLEYRFCAPEAFARGAAKLVSTPKNFNGLTGIVHIRKPQYHFGWDFAPYLPVSGIKDDVYLECGDVARISDFRITQKFNSDNSVTLSLVCTAENFSDNEIDAVFSVLSPYGTEYGAAGVPVGNGEFKADIEIVNPELWQTHDRADKREQPLYEVIASLTSAGEIVDGRIEKTGLRKITLDTAPDEYGKNFRIILNDVPLFAKGANYIPPDIVYTTDKKRITDTLDAVTFAGMNMLRVFGGSVYPDDFFFEECDRRGILVWQDFMFACQGYPFFLPTFEENCKNEAVFQIKRLRNHPSLALWCGNNEVEQMSIGWIAKSKYADSIGKYFYETLPALVRTYDDRDYTPGSPCGVDYLFGFDADNTGDCHIWSVWHGLQPVSYYEKRLPRFASEFGMMSLPDEKTIDGFFKDNEKKVVDAKSLKLRDRSHGGIRLIKYYSLSRFNIPRDLGGWIYASQLSVAESLYEAVSHFRRNKGRVNGTLIWQMNDVWPGISWSLTDYFGRYKAALYALKRAYAPVAVNVKKTDGGFYVYVFNDTDKEISANLTFQVCNYDGKVLLEKVSGINAAPGENKLLFGKGMAAVRNQNKKLRCYALAKMTVDGKEYTDTVLLRREKYAKLPSPEISESFEFISDGVLEIRLVSNVYAHGVRLINNINDAPFSDNWFDLIPGREKTVTVNLGRTCPIENIGEKITVSSCADLKTRGGAFAAFFRRLGIKLVPLHFVNYIAAKRPPRDVKKKYVDFYSKEDEI